MSTKAAHTRERILAAAETIVLRQGFAGTPLDDILKATRLTKGAFFHHFKGKADLAAALVESYREVSSVRFERFAAEADAASDDPLDATLTAFLFASSRLLSRRGRRRSPAASMPPTHTRIASSTPPSTRSSQRA